MLAVLRPWGFGKCCACSCCGGGGNVCVPWFEGWNDEGEVATNWTPEDEGSYILVDGTVRAAGGGLTSLRRDSMHVWFIGSSIGSENGPDSGSSFGLEGAGFAVIRFTEGDTWAVDVNGNSTEVFPSNPTEQQEVIFEWNSFGDYRITVGDTETLGNDPAFVTFDTVTVSVFGAGWVGSMLTECDQYVPIFDLMITEDGDIMITESGDFMEVQ